MKSNETINLSVEQINTLLNQINKINNEESIKGKKGHIEKLKSGSYRFTYMFNSKKYRETFKNIKSEEEAEKKLNDWISDIENGVYKKTNMTVSEFSQKWLDKQIRPNCSGDRTPNKYINFLNNWFLPKFGNKKIRSIDMEQIINFFNWLRTQNTRYTNRENHLLSAGTLYKYHSILYAMFETARLWGKIDINPVPPKARINFNITIDGKPRNPVNTVNAKIEKKLDYYSEKEYKKAIEILDKEENKILRNRKLSHKEKHFKYGRLLAIELDFKTGLRRSELYALTKKDFDLKNATLTVSKTRQLTKSKGNETLITKNLTSQRIVTLPESIIKKVKKFLDMTPDFFEYIFEDFSIDGLSSFWNRFQKQNDLRVISLRDIRHTHGAILFYLGVDIKIISQRLGHSSIQTTERIYLFIIVELRQKVAKQIDNL